MSGTQLRRALLEQRRRRGLDGSLPSRLFVVATLFLCSICSLPTTVLALKSDNLRLFVDTVHFPFLHGVASADPQEDKVLIWTRITPPPNTIKQQDSQPLEVEWRVWEKTKDDLDKDELWDTTTPIQSGVAKTSSDADHTVTIDVTGLKAGTHYYYQFQDQSSPPRRSIVGTTKTISRDLESVNVAVLSCTSLWSGYFNMYRHLAQRTDIEMILHLGDFIYPELDPDELYRIPYGLCPYSSWFQPETSFSGAPQTMLGAASTGLTGSPQDNADPYLVKLVEEFPYCEPSFAAREAVVANSTVALARYRWMYNLYLMDPDLRAARANHPFVVQFDNHDLGDELPSLEMELESGQPGPVQAGLEWVPQRVRHNTNIQRHDANSTWEEDGILSVDLLRRFQYGKDNLLDIIVLDTASYSGGAPQKIIHGMLGEGQREWVNEVLTNSTQSGVQWRILASGKGFMPLTLNKLGWALVVPIAMILLVLMLLAFLVVTCEVGLVWSRGVQVFPGGKRARARSLEMDLLTRHQFQELGSLSFSEDQDEEDDEDEQPEKKIEGLGQVFQHIQKARRHSPTFLGRCSRFLVSGVMVWPFIAIVASLLTNRIVNPSDGGLFNFDNQPVTWAGQHDSVTRFFDQLEATGADSNNLWVTGDTHICYASDVFRYDPTGKDILHYNPHRDDVKRYGVEMLPCSGTRGNLDEMIGSILPFCHPKYFTSRVSSFISHFIVTIMNNHYRYFNGDDHGYGLVKVTPSHVETTFYLFPILKVTDQYHTKTMVVRHGENKWN